MAGPMIYTQARYLAAKRTVDDRALNAAVWRRLVEAVRAASVGQTAQEPLRVIEVGFGLGAMVERGIEWGLFDHVEYTAVDADAAILVAARARLTDFALARGWPVTAAGATLTLRHNRGVATVEFVHRNVEAAEFLQSRQSRCHLVIAHAFLDLVDPRRALATLLDHLMPGGWLNLTINFDGVTAFDPPIDPELDATIERLYHRTMDERHVHGGGSGGSQTGRRLFGDLRAVGAEILAAGGSDWVVCADSNGYPADEAYFLRHIVDTVRGALEHHPELDPARFRTWIEHRLVQIDRRELVYIAHQLDILARKPTGRQS